MTHYLWDIVAMCHVICLRIAFNLFRSNTLAPRCLECVWPSSSCHHFCKLELIYKTKSICLTFSIIHITVTGLSFAVGLNSSGGVLSALRHTLTQSESIECCWSKQRIIKMTIASPMWVIIEHYGVFLHIDSQSNCKTNRGYKIYRQWQY